MPLSITFPLSNDDKSNFFLKTNDTTKESLRSKLLFLLLTEEGSRFRKRKFGVKLIKYIFEPNDDITKTDVVNEIKDKVKIYIPQIEIDDVEFIQPEDSESETVLSVNITFTYISVDSSQDNITINFSA